MRKRRHFISLLAGLATLLTFEAAHAQDLAIHHIDVGQGDATLLVMPNGSTLLIDSGLDSEGDTVADFLDDLNITVIDAFVATHYDADHYGGIDKVLDTGISANAFFDRGERQYLPPSKTIQLQFTQYVTASGTPTRLMPGMQIELDPTVSVMVVASNGHVRGAVGKYEINSLNENGFSVAFVVSFNGFDYFIGGDLTEPVERRLVLEAAIGNLDVYKVSHHGSDTSSETSFLAAIDPEVAIISNGSLSCFNHPRAAVLARLDQIPGIEIYQTNRLQDLVQCASGKTVGGNAEFIADPETSDSDGTITITVGSDTYTVSMPARSFSREFPIER